MSDAALLNIAIDRSLEASLFNQIYDALRERIVSGKLAAGDKLPSSRTFAEELGVSRSSIVNAYDQLIVEGYAESRPGSGLFVSDLPELEVGSTSVGASYKGRVEDASLVEPGMLCPGIPDMRLFPYDKWAKCVAKVARDYPEEIIRVQSRFGDVMLRHEIARHLEEWRGISVSPERIIVTAGALGALELISPVVTNKGDYVGLENPGYQAFLQYVAMRQLKPVWMDVDEEGARIPSSNSRKPGLIFLTPSYQYPLGGCMSKARRTEFLNYASKNESWIIEDDFDSEFRYSGRPVQALAGMDEEGRVIYVGSFSKIFSGGLRVGYLVIPEKLVDRFAGVNNKFNNPVSIAPQRALAKFMESGEFHKHIRRMRRTYAARRKHFLSCLENHDLPVCFEDHQAGMQIALYFSQDADDKAVSEELDTHGITCPPLTMFYSQGARPGLLTGFCLNNEEEIELCLTTVASVIKKTA